MNWKRKLTSRKFWSAVVAFITAVAMAYNMGENEIAQITAIISAFGVIVCYLFAESKADSANKKEGDDNSKDKDDR